MFMGQRRHLFLAALAGFVLLGSFSFSSQQMDPFYLNIFEKAQKSFLARNYPEAARDFEIAAFGLMGNKSLQAKAKVYLGLCRYHLNDLEGSEKCLREAADAMGERGFASLEIYESAWPDLNRLISFFNLTGSKNESIPREVGKPLEPDPDPKSQPEKAGGSAEKPQEKPDKDTPKGDEQKTISAPSSKINFQEIKEGDLLPLDLVDTRPEVIKRIPAVYPQPARSNAREGTVIINALVSEKGTVIKTEILKGMSGAFGFDQAAAQAVRRWKFEPATIKGKKVKVWVPVSIRFRKGD